MECLENKWKLYDKGKDLSGHIQNPLHTFEFFKSFKIKHKVLGWFSKDGEKWKKNCTILHKEQRRQEKG